VGRFLEHSRIFYFSNNGKEEIYLGSADWMYRNLSRRVELVFPVKDPKLRDHLKEILDCYLNDNVNARELKPDGTYVRVKAAESEKRRDAQLELESTSI